MVLLSPMAVVALWKTTASLCSLACHLEREVQPASVHSECVLFSFRHLLFDIFNSNYNVKTNYLIEFRVLLLVWVNST